MICYLTLSEISLLISGSFRYYLELPDAEEQDSTQGSEDKANEKKRKKSSEGTEEQEKPGPSPFSYHSPKKSAKKPMFSQFLFMFYFMSSKFILF